MKSNKKIKTSKVDLMLTPDEAKEKKITWYPGHMVKALRQVQERIKKVDIVFEIRDARAPLASKNKELKRLLGEKSVLVLINKSDLISDVDLKKWQAWFKENEPNSMFISSTKKTNYKSIVSYAYEILNKKHQISNPDTQRSKKMRVMIVGIPNCGKSTIINSLVSRKAASATNKPGHTKAQQWIKLDQDTELLDTPGIMPPRIETEIQGKWLSAIHAVPDSTLGKDEVALFILRHSLKENYDILKRHYKLEDELKDPLAILEFLAISRGALAHKGLPDYDRIYQFIINDFREGKLGKVCFESL